jgi:hypothetical protein
MSEEEDWKSTVNALVRAKQELAVAWALVDEVGAEPAVEEHLIAIKGYAERNPPDRGHFLVLDGSRLAAAQMPPRTPRPS